QVAEKRPQGIQSRILERIQSEYPSREQLRALRAVEILELMRTDHAVRMLVELANGAPESLLTHQAKAALERHPKEGPPRGGGLKLEALWTELALDDPRPAFQAIRALSARRQKAVRFLHDQLRLTAASGAFDDDPQRLARLIADLGRDDFVTREKA